MAKRNMTDSYIVDIEVFEGPLDLLLYLVRKEEVDIYDIPIERITSQYIEYLSMMDLLDLNMAGEFILMAATLMAIKSRMLLPVDDAVDGTEEEEEDDPRWDLVRQLVEYKRFKDAAGRLHERALMQEAVFGPGQPGIDISEADDGAYIEDVSIFDLLAALQKALERARAGKPDEIEGLRFTIEDKVERLLALTRGQGRVPFTALFREYPCRDEVICAFLALLELIRLRQVTVMQSIRFGGIMIQGCVSADTAMTGDPCGLEKMMA